jgi:hypothetical protein
MLDFSLGSASDSRGTWRHLPIIGTCALRTIWPPADFCKGGHEPKGSELARCQWLTSVILATQEAEIRRIVVQSQPGQIVHELLS